MKKTELEQIIREEVEAVIQEGILKKGLRWASKYILRRGLNGPKDINKVVIRDASKFGDSLTTLEPEEVFPKLELKVRHVDALENMKKGGSMRFSTDAGSVKISRNKHNGKFDIELEGEWKGLAPNRLRFRDPEAFRKAEREKYIGWKRPKKRDWSGRIPTPRVPTTRISLAPDEARE